jgi:hypothetical protein
MLTYPLFTIHFLHTYPASIKYPTPEFFIVIWGPLTSLLHLNCKLPFADGSQNPSMIAI